MSRAAMQQALEAIEGSGHKADLIAAADALRAALAEQAQPTSEAGWLHRLDVEKSEAWMAGYAQGQKRAAEQAQPVAEVGWAAGRPNTIIEYRWLDWDHPPEPGMTLFAAPPRPSAPQRLTDEDIEAIPCTDGDGSDWEALLRFARAVEAEVLRRMGVQR